MGYLENPNQFQSYKFILDSIDVQNCGTNPIQLIDLTPNNFNGEIFFPLFASLRIINQSNQYNFNSQSHIQLSSGGNVYMIWQQLLNGMTPNNYAFTSLYVQHQHNYGGTIYTGNVEPIKSGHKLTLTTNDMGDATSGDGQLIVVINGFKTLV
jgi:hypothetical protein